MTYPPDELIRLPLKVIREAQAESSSRKHTGRLPARREVGETRARLAKEEEVLRNEGPARIISAIALNPGKTARWSRNGLEGDEEDWVSPSDEEIMWWGWFYRKARQEKDFLKRIPGEKRLLLHAVFIARVRRQKGEMAEKEFHDFLGTISDLIPDDDPVVGSLQQISRKFSSCQF